jgi:peptidoglycan/LPS O-acetylase OafA/YrhL
MRSIDSASPAPRSAAPRRLDALTGIRPFASFAVFFFHFGRPLVAGAPPWLRSLTGSGFVAVSFFYVLSGFVLTLGHRAQFADGRFDGRRFFLRRAARLLPAAWLALALLVPLALHRAWGEATGAFPAGTPLVLPFLLHLGLVQAWLPPLALRWNLPAWSVSVELAFYLVFPLMARALFAASRRARIVTLAAAWAASLALTLAYVLYRPDGVDVGPDSEAFFLDALKFWPPARLPEFVFGVALGALYTPGGRCPRALAPLSLASLVAILAAAHRLPYPLLHNALLLPVFGGLLVATAAAHGVVARALSWRPLVALGRTGYAFYIVQMPLMHLVLLGNQAGLPAWSGAGFFVRFLVLVLAVALLVRRFVEAPLQPRLEAWLVGYFGRSSTKSATAIASSISV